MNTRIWLIRFTDRCGTPRATVHGQNAIADFRDIDPAATVEELDALALSELLAADLRMNQVIQDTRDHHHRVATRGSMEMVQADITRELCERYIEAERDRYAAIERCTQPAGPEILKNNTDFGELEVKALHRQEVSTVQVDAIVRSIKAAMDGAAKASLLLSLNGLGDSALWRRMDALESEMKEAFVALKPAIFFDPDGSSEVAA